jgi:hypothetical protein
MDQQTQVFDPLSELDKPYSPPAFEIWGLANLNAWFAALVKGVGKEPFDPAKHKSRVTAVDISITPISEQDAQPITRNLIRESREWGLIQNSLQACGCPKAAEINGKFVHVILEPTGETYTNNNNEVKNKTYIKFVQIFADEAACVADYRTAHPADSAAPAQVNPDGSQANNKERETALKFLQVIVNNNGRGQTDLAAIQSKVASAIAGMPVVNKYFTADSPETLEMIAAVMG